ncbi:MAG: cadmium-translocating P-type ATPase [Verrucomicrobia bacterium]|nr:cadmium-translocating P-type ATPase [Verrucomicrobiota bacterium]
MILQKSSVTTRREAIIAVLAIAAIAVHLVLRFGFHATEQARNGPLLIALALGGMPLVWVLLIKLFRREFGSDLLAGISIVTSVFLGEYLAGTLVVLMLSGGEALESYAVRSASSVLQALAKRMPSAAHRKQHSIVIDVPLKDIAVGDTVLVFPHEICPVDGTVIEGHGVMDESYLTGEPYKISKTPGAAVLSGAINGESVLTVQADKLAVDSRHAKIMRVMETSQQQRPRLRRLGDQLGGFYTPVAVLIGLVAWALSGEAVRFLAVMVVATPCPLLIAIPVAIIGSISLSAKRGIIVKDPVALERVENCRVLIFDKTGTLTYGEPQLVEQTVMPDFKQTEVLSLAASLERYSKHPLAQPILQAAKTASVAIREANQISERPGKGLRGMVADRHVEITSRKRLMTRQSDAARVLPSPTGGMECVILIDDRLAAIYHFCDTPRQEGAAFVGHLSLKHHFERVLLVSGDRESEVRYLADQVGIREVFASQSPEQKVAIVQEETQRGNTIFVGDGINDAPALMVATVGIALGQNSDITTEAAGVVIMDSSLQRVDEFMHISRRMRSILLQSAIGGMALSVIGMIFAAFGFLPPVAGAVYQEIIDVLAVANALRVALRPKTLTDY